MSQQTTTSNNDPTNDEILQKQLIARYNPGRFVTTSGHCESGRFGTIFSVHDTSTKTDLVLKCQQRLDLFKREKEVLEIMKGDFHFPQMVEYFGIVNPPNVINYSIAMTKEGESIQKLMGGRPTCWSIGNCVRLLYQLVEAVQALHNLGYCHRDLHVGNVTIKRESDGGLTVKLIDFNGAVKLDPPPYPTCVMTTWQASLQVCQGMPFTCYDDLTSAVFILLKVRNIDPFENYEQLTESKKSFDQNPHVWFGEDIMWIAKIYVAIQKQRSRGIDYSGLLGMLRIAVPGINPLSPMDYRTTRGNPIVML
ncbi:unnamed protein product [Caenorhabditis nigoni]|uniref:Protein kinase domain-containing protein n=1 Tax=Caenorhabditis nigoni TaxID=1611254 RepID=A0A2G5SND2_9PELO|nr:hypothetical protein B9Z55_023087 [Caenorhabditis nigoni]